MEKNELIVSSLLGYGTWQASPGEVGQGVYEALKVGYRHLDLAKVYGNQPEIAEALKKSFAEIPGLKREDVFITSKLWNSQHDPKQVEAALDDCLQELGLEYLDLYLIHFPVSFKNSGAPIGQDLFPLTGGNQPDGDVVIDDSISIVDTWKGEYRLYNILRLLMHAANLNMYSRDRAAQVQGPRRRCFQPHQGARK